MAPPQPLPLPLPPPHKILNPATGKYVKVDGAIGKKIIKSKIGNVKMSKHSKSESEVMYHIFSFNIDIPTEMSVASVPEAEINQYLVYMCTDYYDLLDLQVPKKLAVMAASTSESDTIKLIKRVKKLSNDMGDFCKKLGGCDNKGILICGIVKGGKNIPLW